MKMDENNSILIDKRLSVEIIGRVLKLYFAEYVGIMHDSFNFTEKSKLHIEILVILRSE